MTSITKFETGHEDLVHGIEYDYYGKRLVTCSSDQKLKVWDFVSTDNLAVWELNDAWKAHDASVMKALWAPPEYGQIIASCSFDRTVKIWEEQPVESKNSQRRWSERFRLVESKGAVLDIAFSPMQGALRLASCSADGMIRIYEALEPTNLAQWSQMEEFSIHMGKDTASSSMATPPLSTMVPTSSLLSQQQQLQQHQIHEQQQLQQLHQIQNGTLDSTQFQSHHIQQHQQQYQQSSASSSPGSQKDDRGEDQHQFQSQQPHYQQQQQQQSQYSTMNSTTSSRSNPPHLDHFASPPSSLQPNLPQRTPSSASSGGGSGSADMPQLPYGHLPTTPGIPPPMTLPAITSSLTMSSLDQQQQIQHHQHQHQQLSQQQQRHHPMDIESGYCIHWCPNRTAHAMMVVGLGKEAGAKIFKHDGHNRWYPGEMLQGHTAQVNDVSWAPSMGRSYQLIATACKDHHVRIFKLTDTRAPASTASNTLGTRVNMLSKQAPKHNGSYQVEMVAEFGEHQAEVWRVEWNITGTILSSSGSDGKVRLWRASYDGKWKEMAVINTSSQAKSS